MQCAIYKVLNSYNNIHTELDHMNYRDSSPKNENHVINYSPSCHSKPWPSFIFKTQIKIFFNEIQELSDPAKTAM